VFIMTLAVPLLLGFVLRALLAARVSASPTVASRWVSYCNAALSITLYSLVYGVIFSRGLFLRDHLVQEVALGCHHYHRTGLRG
jgi:hypothetical protein